MSELLNKERLTEKIGSTEIRIRTKSQILECLLRLQELETAIENGALREVDECELNIITYETVIKSQKIMCLGCNSILRDTRPNYCQYCGRKIKRGS